jgi:signal transduction histidine kinase
MMSKRSVFEGGEMAALVRAFDWSTTPLGPLEAWPNSLRTTVGILLHSRHPMFLWWGPELVQIYNDAYRPSFGEGKHPAALGQRGRDCWQEIWPIIWPQIDDVMTHARPSWNEDALVPIFRNGRIEEVYWTYGYSPVFDDLGAVGGTLVVCTETTARVIADRRRRLLREVSERTADIADQAQLLPRAAAVAAAHTRDLAFVALFDASETTGAIVHRHGVNLDARALDAVAQLLDPGGDEPRVLLLPDGIQPVERAWPEPCREVFVTRVAASGPGVVTFAAFGLSPRLPFDDACRDFFSQLCDVIATSAARVEVWRVRSLVEAERDNLLLKAPMATAVLTGPEHVFQLANPLYRQIVGRDDIVGKSYHDAFPELVDTPLPGILARVYATGEPFVTHELLVPLVRDAHGYLENCYFKFNLEAMRDAGGKIYGMLAVAVDITEQVAARHALEKTHAERELLLAQLEAASRAKDEFFAMLGHELRNPLSPIVTSLELMKLGRIDPASQLPLIERQIHHMVGLVDDLLDVARITRGQLNLVRVPLELSTVIARAIETASTAIETGRHVLSLDVPAHGLPVLADATRLAQVLSNLLTNAAKYTPPGGQIWIEARSEGGEAVVRVRDTGVGIEPAMLSRIFELFTQVPQDLARSQGGLGLGLAIVKSLTENHGGKVSARSAGRGLGSEFIVCLPLAEVDPRRDPAEPPPITAAESRPGTPRRILIVDDNEDAAWLLAETLTHVGHQVRVAHDAPTALQAAVEHQPELALLDIGLPVMNGYELAMHLRAEPRIGAVRLIALTGYGQPGDHARSREAGFAAHLTKPVLIDVLIETIERVV